MIGRVVVPISIALVGFGKIARDQHVPAIAADQRFRLIAAIDPALPSNAPAAFADLDALLAAGMKPDAIAICTPPAARAAIARRAIEAGLHVLLEKPPCATVAEIEDVRARSVAAGVTLFTAWHSREASGVAPARLWLAGKTVRRVAITWKEDIRVWHPGQEWILDAGGFGVFDPGINALSIVTALLPGTARVSSASLCFPRGRSAPLAAELALDVGGVPVAATFDFLQTGPQTWDIEIETDAGTLLLSHGGADLAINGNAQPREPNAEYPRLYARFADLIADARSEVDLAPLVICEDALAVGVRREGSPFAFAEPA